MVSRDFRHTTQHGAIKGKKQIGTVRFYSLDAILSVGYRVNSVQATQFRIWATKTLKDHLLKGYTINQKRIKELKDEQLEEFKEAVGLIKKTIETKQISTDETKGLLQNMLILGQHCSNMMKISCKLKKLQK